jgi:hypothetical protein
MKGISKLTAYAGQLITMKSEGKLLIGGMVLMSGSSSLYAKASSAASAKLSGVSSLYCLASTAPIGKGYLHAVSSIGSDTTFAIAKAYLQPVYGYANDDYTPPIPDYGIGYLSSFASWGYAEGAAGEGSGNLHCLLSRGGDHEYAGIGKGTLNSLWSAGIYDTWDLAKFITSATMYDAIEPTTYKLIIFSSTGTIVDTITGSKSYIQEILSDIEASSIFSSVAELNIKALTSIIASSLTVSQIGEQASLYADSRTWVVNMETGASGQYDNYGFLKFFERDGEYYGIAEDGIYKLDGDDDAGTDIQSLIEMGRSNLGTDHKKKITNVYAGVSSDGKLLLKVDADGDSYTYQALSSSTNLKNHRFDVGKGLVGNYYNLTLLNQDSNDFDLESISFEPITFNRRI